MKLSREGQCDELENFLLSHVRLKNSDEIQFEEKGLARISVGIHGRLGRCVFEKSSGENLD
jgi:hypothetical protein